VADAGSALGRGPAFPVLFNGGENPDAVKLRKKLFEMAWPVLEDRIQVGYSGICFALRAVEGKLYGMAGVCGVCADALLKACLERSESEYAG